MFAKLVEGGTQKEEKQQFFFREGDVMSKKQAKTGYTKVSLVVDFLRGNLHYFVISILSALAVTGIDMITPQLIRSTVDSVIGTEPLDLPAFAVRLVEQIGGVDYLRGANYSIIPDQIEAGTYMAAAVATRGNVLVRGVIPKHLESITAKLEEMGATVEELEDEDAIRVSCDKPLRHCTVKTMPHPGFPTDMQPQIAVLLALAEGTSFLTENIWDNRFKYLSELRRMGADVTVNGNTAVFQGVAQLKGAPVRANDLRAGAAMVIAGLSAKGVTIVDDICYIERGYEDIVEKLQALGADIERIYVAPSTAQAM